MAHFPIKQRSLFFILFPLILAFIFFLSGVKSPSKFGRAEQVVFSVFSQIQKTTGFFVSVPVNAWKKYCWLLKTKENNTILTQEVKRLRQENIFLRESSLANKRFREILDFKALLPFKAIAAEVIGVDSSLYFKTVFIDKGGKEKIKPHMAVLNPDGIVGKILKVADSSSIVLLLVDQNFSLDVLVQKTRSKGVVEGTGRGLCRMKYVVQSEKINPGDLIVSSGLEGFFPKGGLVGEVVSVNKGGRAPFQNIIIKPLVDFSRLEEIIVVLDH